MFKCQRDSFLKRDKSVVVSCQQITDVKSAIKDFTLVGLCENARLFKVILDDTILFPEGGGQPDDRGKIDGIQVIRVVRDAHRAVHYVADCTPSQSECGESTSAILPFSVGQTVEVELDWERRLDNMQQHSGQHLITAIADQMFGFPTTSWNLGKDDSFIELDTRQITLEQITAIEDVVNAKIGECLPCTVEVVELDDPKLKTARGRNLPADVTGNIRIVTMGDIESNVCCGTHITNLSQLQIIKLLYAIPRKGKTLLYFLSGKRVSKKFSEMIKREVELTNIMSSTAGDLPAACEKLNLSLKATKKSLRTVTKDLASIEAKVFKQENSSEDVLWHFHRDNVDPDYAATFIRELGAVGDRLLFLSFKYESNSGNFYLVNGPNILSANAFQELCNEISTLLDGKGSMRGNQYQAKISKPNHVTKAVSRIQEVLKSKPNEL